MPVALNPDLQMPATISMEHSASALLNTPGSAASQSEAMQAIDPAASRAGPNGEGTPNDMIRSPCRLCGTEIRETFCDLGLSPIGNAFVSCGCAHGMEPFYPLHARVCGACLLVQLDEFEPPELIFSNL